MLGTQPLLLQAFTIHLVLSWSAPLRAASSICSSSAATGLFSLLSQPQPIEPPGGSVARLQVAVAAAGVGAGEF